MASVSSRSRPISSDRRDDARMESTLSGRASEALLKSCSAPSASPLTSSSSPALTKNAIGVFIKNAIGVSKECNRGIQRMQSGNSKNAIGEFKERNRGIHVLERVAFSPRPEIWYPVSMHLNGNGRVKDS
jgi:hypothetical protein